MRMYRDNRRAAGLTLRVVCYIRAVSELNLDRPLGKEICVCGPNHFEVDTRIAFLTLRSHAAQEEANCKKQQLER